jgi:predicted ester cyclase
VALFTIVSDTHDLVRSFYDDLWNRCDDSRVAAVLSPTFEFRGSLGAVSIGRDGWLDYRTVVRSGSSDFHNEIVSLVCEDDRAAARLLYTGTHTGHLLGYPPTRRRFEYAGAAFFTVADGRLASAWVLGDLVALREQLG